MYTHWQAVQYVQGQYEKKIHSDGYLRGQELLDALGIQNNPLPFYQSSEIDTRIAHIQELVQENLTSQKYGHEAIQYREEQKFNNTSKDQVSIISSILSSLNP